MFSAGAIAESQSVSVRYKQEAFVSKDVNTRYGSTMTTIEVQDEGPYYLIGTVTDGIGEIQEYTDSDYQDNSHTQPYDLYIGGTFQKCQTIRKSQGPDETDPGFDASYGDGVHFSLAAPYDSDVATNNNVSWPDNTGQPNLLDFTYFRGISTDLGFLPTEHSSKQINTKYGREYDSNTTADDWDLVLQWSAANSTDPNTGYAPNDGNGNFKPDTNEMITMHYRWDMYEDNGTTALWDDIIGTNLVGTYKTLEIIL